ncbi:MAG: isoprenoid biosynthesis glyoxalase ElbB [Deltaproteobacteria bacterium]|nr:isoprenoid biosynthesis glyoxalase ElbB [Deltaproteobacteria bacterium]
MSQGKRVAIVLSGCGVFDGAEIHESVMTMLAVDRRGASYQCFAPDIAQHHVVNHLTGDATGESRNVLVEAARIARGAIKPLHEYHAEDFDALIFPGGFGAAKNLSDFAFRGDACQIDDQVKRAISATHQAGKPIGALCIAPAIIAKMFDGVTVTIGQDKDTAATLEKMGAKHQVTTHGGVCLDERYKVVTGPCYMLEATISQIADGADNVVAKLLELAGN